MQNNIQQKIYLIPGLGTTGDIFKYLELPNVEMVFLNFIEPLPKENLSDYASRMASVIPPEEEPILLGVSMGGFIAQEIGKIRPVKKILLVSSLRSGQKWQPYLIFLKNSNLAYMLPPGIIKGLIVTGLKVLGIPRKWKNELLEMTRTFSPQYFQFAGKKLLNWKGAETSCELIQIHGNRDEVFPISNASPKYIVNKGSHFMIGTHGREISDLILKELGE